MGIKKIIFVVAAVISVFAANSQTSDISEGCAPAVVQFTAPAGSATWFWDFQDGATSNLQNPSNTFTTPGTYIVEFSNSPAGPVAGTVTITIHPKPVPVLTASTLTQGCAPLNVTMAVNTSLPGGVGLTSYNWTFGDGGGGAGTPVSHVYGAGIFSISIELITNSPTCNVTTIYPDFISASNPPAAAFTTNPNPPSSCTTPFAVNFTNTTTSSLPLTYTWNMGNGNTYTTLNPASQTYTANGAYPVVLTATDTNNCSATFTQNVSIGQPVANFSIPDTVCINVPVDSLENLSSTGASFWSLGAGGSFLPPYNSNSFEPTIQFSTPGMHFITLTTIAGACTNDTTIAVYVEEPTVTFTAVPAYSCYEPLSVQYNGSSPNNVTDWDWSFGDSIQNPVFVHDVTKDSADIELGENSIPATLTITTANGCIASFTSPIIINLPWARFIPDLTEGCAPLTVTFNDSTRSNEPVVNWSWEYDDGSPVNSLASGAPHTHVFNTPGEYDVVLTITNSLGCKDTSYPVRIEVGGPVVLDFTVDKVDICPGETVTFTNLTADSANVDAWHYSASEELLSHCFTDGSPSFVFDGHTGPQSITLTAEYNGCYSTITKPNLINVKGPIAGFDYLIDCNTPYDIQLTDTSQDATSLTWDFGDGTSSTSGGTFTHTYAASGDYTIILTAVNSTSGCPASSDTIVAHIRNIVAMFATDSLLCGGSSYSYDASPSIDVGPSCYRGYTWFFSDPSMRPITSSSPNSPISFSNAGAQTVGLVVMDINGCKDTLIKTVEVYNLVPSYTVSDMNICLPDTISFTNMSTSDTTITSYSWSFGDGTPNGSTQNATHIYNTAAGSAYLTSLTITNALGCTGTLTQLITIYTPTSVISSLPNICLGQPVTLNATNYTSQGSGLSYNWNFGDGNFATGNNQSHVFTTSGSHLITLTYSEIATGCTGTATVNLNIQDYPVAGFVSDVDSLTTLCNPQQVNFTNTSTSSSPITPLWNWGAGTSNSSALSLVFATGTHNVSLVVSTSYGCKDTVTKVLNVVGPAGDFIMSNNNICKGDVITFTLFDTLDVGSYSWDFGDGFSIDNVSPVSHPYNFLPPSGQTVAKLTVYGQDNVCPVVVQQTVFIHYVKADFTRNDSLLCLGESVSFINTSSPPSGNIFTWNLGDGTTSGTSTGLSHTYADTGTYHTILIAQNSSFGCRDTTTKLITVLPLPIVDPVGDSVCMYSAAQLSVNGYDPANNYIYSWTPGTELNNDSIYNPTLTGLNSGSYTVTVVDTNSCRNTGSAYLYVVPPLTGFVWDTTIVLGDSAMLPISNADGTILFTWTPPDGLSCLQCSNPSARPLEEMTYMLYAEDIFGCTNATYYFNIDIHPEIFVELPTTFTPNGDGVNDVIYVKGWGIKELQSFQIYNRWGELVFESNDLVLGWDGFYKGILQNNDVYVYKVRAMSWSDQELSKEGHINLMR
ncbi:MAG TPA: PKD domain-containing protein [Bacteroidia bacterium]|jgi:gliding motility-associated-like protein